jgi:adenylate kinase
VRNLGWVQLSAGNLCRQEIAQGTEIGRQIDFTIKSGKLIPDGLITRMIEGALTRYIQEGASVILDGYPRTVTQAQELDRMLAKDEFGDISLSLVKLCVGDETIVKRMTSRLICPDENCQAVYSLAVPSLSPARTMECDRCASTLIRRADDNELVVRDRLMAYYEHEKNLLDYYQRHGCRFREISVERSLDEVFKEFEYTIGIEGK